jgi:peptide/nickel transport system substrate-binding protein
MDNRLASKSPWRCWWPRRAVARALVRHPAVCMLVGALLLGAGPAVAEHYEGDSLRLLLWQAPTTLNPHLSIGTKDQLASRIVYEPLASFDAEGVLVPFLAAEIPSLEGGGVAADGRSVTWKLKPDVRWADGEPFTADDVVFTYAYLSNPEVGATTRGSYQMVDRVEAIDDHTVEVHFSTVNPAWAVPFMGPSGMILPRHIFEPYDGANAKEAPANRLAVGTGPYRVATFKEEDFLAIGDDVVSMIRVDFEPNPYYREPDKPYFARVELRGGGDPETAAKAVFEAGTVDYAYNMQIDRAELKALEALGHARLVAAPPVSVERIMLNFSDPHHATEAGERASVDLPHPILSDPLVRRALALAIDRAAIAALYEPIGAVANNLVISPKTYASPHTTWSYDLEAAAALLDEAGWIDSDGDGVRDKDGVALRLEFQTSINPIRQKTQEIVRSALASIGVAIEPRIVDASIFFGPVSESTNTIRHFFSDLQMYSSNNDNPEPDDYLRRWICDEAAQQANQWSAANRARYCNPAYDDLYRRLGATLDPQQRRDLVIAMNDLLIEDVALIPLVERPIAFGLSNQIVLGRDPTPWDLDFWDLADWRRQ